MMFTKRASQQELAERDMQQQAMAARHQIEVAHLQDRIRKLEQALAQLIEASDSALVDMRRPDADADQIQPGADSGFAAAWSKADAQGERVDDQFFTNSQVDEQARSWLLTAKQ